MNESFIHADIFFFISTIALVVITVLLSIAAVYLIRILRDASEVSEKIKEEGGEIAADLKRLRANLRDEGVKWKHVASLARALFGRKAKTAKRKAAEALHIDTK